MVPIEIKKNLYWVGAVDWNIRDFHGYSTPTGSTYNSFLLIDDKVTLFDTVKKPFLGEMLRHVKRIIDPHKIDYLVVNHVEMDHSGAITEVVELINPEKIFCSPMGKKALEGHFSTTDWPIEVVKSGDTVSTGKKSVQFIETRMLHWPDSMFSYIPEERLLISSDAFGQHWATSERYDDEVDLPRLIRHAAKYYANILMPYSALVDKLLTSLAAQKLEIDMIAPDHGLIWRSHISEILQSYETWCRHITPKKALIIYDTMWHSTEKMAQSISLGLSEKGIPYKLMNAKLCHRSDIVTEILDAKALIFGSPTLNNGMLPTIADVLCYVKGLRPLKRIGAAFGSYGWSGESVKLITEILQQMKLEVVEPGIRINYVPSENDLLECREFGRNIGDAILQND